MSEFIGDRIRKLLDLAAGAEGPEKDAAFAAATRLAARYGLDLEDIEDGPAPEPGYGEAVLFVQRRAPRWKCLLAAACGNITGCFVAYYKRTSMMKAVGKPRALVATSVLFHAALDYIERELDASNIMGLRARNTWRLGFSDGLLAAHLNTPALPGTTTGLVLAGAAAEAVKAAEQHIADQGTQVSTRTVVPTGTIDDYAAGRAAGAAMQKPAERLALGDGQ